MSFALASLSCTIAPFLAVTAGSLRSGGPWGVGAAFVTYALGMGVVVLGLALAVAVASASVVGAMRQAAAVISRAGGVLLVVAGAYVAWYGWFELRALSGDARSDPVISAAVGVQAAIARWLSGWGPAGPIAVAAGLAVLWGVVALRRHRMLRDRRRHGPIPHGGRAPRRAMISPWPAHVPTSSGSCATSTTPGRC